MLKTMVRSIGLDPEQVLSKVTLAEPHRTYTTPAERENEEMRRLTTAFTEKIRNTPNTSPNSPDLEIHRQQWGPTQPAMLMVKIKGPRNEGDPFFTESVLPTLGRERMSSGKGAGILGALICLVDPIERPWRLRPALRCVVDCS